ncbi:MAG: hypothetical protein E7169_00735 [Firmicutes bacterium]|nr:hypothetical protein [Bacillota bacterium]
MKIVKKILGVFVLLMAVIMFMPSYIKAAEMSDEFKSYLNKDGEFEINAAKGKTEEDLALYLDFKYSNADLDYSVCWDKISDDLNSFEFGIHCWEDDGKEERHTVNIKYNYDEKVNKTINEYLNSVIKEQNMFKVYDLELVSYWLNTGAENSDVLALYSGELKKLFDYKNIQVFADGRAGGNDKFITSNMGFGSFQNNGIIYKMVPVLGATAEHVIYIDENVGNTEEEVISAVQKRIDNYFGKGKVTVEFAGEGIYDLYMDEYEYEIEYWQEQYDILKPQFEQAEADVQLYCDTNLPDFDQNICNSKQEIWSNLFPQVENAKFNLEYAHIYKENFIDAWNEENGEYEFLKDAYNGWYFFAHMQFGDLMYSPFFVVKKDSSKMVEPFIKTVDSTTNVEINTSATLPLDTTIQANKLTSGTEYERILEILNLTDNVTFDLKLYSNSMDRYITKLEDGAFEVKIPIPENFKGKDLVVYYVKEDGKKESYTVNTTKEPGYAIFTTNHFSIYTLGYTGNSSIEVPETFDGISSSIIISVISLIGLTLASLYLNKRNSVKSN